MKIYLVSGIQSVKITMVLQQVNTAIDEIYYNGKAGEVVAKEVAAQLALSMPPDKLLPMEEGKIPLFFEKKDQVAMKQLLILGGVTFLKEVTTFLFEKSGQKCQIDWKADMMVGMTNNQEGDWKLEFLFSMGLLEAAVENPEIQVMKNYFNVILDYSSDFFYTKDTEYRFGPANANFAALTGHKHWSELLKKTDYDVFPKSDADKYRIDDRTVIEKGIPVSNRMESYRKEDGTTGWVKTSKRPIFDVKGKIIGLFGFSAEISSMIEVEEQIRQQKKEFETIIQTIKEGIIIVDKELNILFFNKTLLKKTGYNVDEFYEKSLIEAVLPKEREEFCALVNRLIKTGNVENVERTFRVKDGKLLRINMAMVLMPDKQRILISARDVTETRRKENLLEKYYKIIDEQVITSSTDIQGQITEVSTAFAKISGYDKEELIGKTHLFLSYDQESKEEWRSKIHRRPEKATWFGVIKNRKKNGQAYWLSTLIYTIFDENGSKIGYTTLSQDMTDKIKVEEKQREQESLLALFDHGDSVLFRWEKNELWNLDYVSENVINLIGYTREDFLNGKVSYGECIHKDDLGQVNEEIRRRGDSKQKFFKHEPYRIVTAKGEIKWVQDSTIIQRNQVGEITYFLDYIIDITEREKTIKNLEKFIDTQDNIVILTDGKKLSFANKKFFEYLGYESLEDFANQHNCICELFVKNDRFFHMGKVKKRKNWIDEMRRRPFSERIVLLRGKNNRKRAFSINVNLFEENLWIVSFADISQTFFNQMSLEEKTVHDKLTGLYNREYFEQNYERLIHEFKKEGYQLGIAMMDIDDFKSVNDHYGHDIGDMILIEFAKEVKNHSRQRDIIIRWGGDEFILILKIDSDENLRIALEKIRRQIEKKDFAHVGQVTCSIGGTLYVDNELIEKTMKRADRAMYVSKTGGRNRVTII